MAAVSRHPRTPRNLLQFKTKNGSFAVFSREVIIEQFSAMTMMIMDPQYRQHGCPCHLFEPGIPISCSASFFQPHHLQQFPRLTPLRPPSSSHYQDFSKRRRSTQPLRIPQVVATISIIAPILLPHHSCMAETSPVQKIPRCSQNFPDPVHRIKQPSLADG